MLVVAAPDKFRGSATAVEIAEAIDVAVSAQGGRTLVRPMADGGEGTLLAFGGANRSALVTGPLGDPVRAGWRLDGTRAVVEMAEASGLSLVGGPEDNDPIAATTSGTGELIATAVEAGARRVIVAVGGSATTDGGLGAIRALTSLPRLRGVQIQVACDVRTRFGDAAEVFGPQKGASTAQVELLRRRLERLAQVYETEHGIDVTELDRSGAAGGLAGGLAAIGAELVDGFDLIADELDLYEAIEQADLVVTGEGRLDAESFNGKVVGGVASLAESVDVPVVAVVGQIDDDASGQVEAIDLSERFGLHRSLHDTTACVTEAVADRLALGLG